MHFTPLRFTSLHATSLHSTSRHATSRSCSPQTATRCTHEAHSGTVSVRIHRISGSPSSTFPLRSQFQRSPFAQAPVGHRTPLMKSRGRGACTNDTAVTRTTRREYAATAAESIPEQIRSGPEPVHFAAIAKIAPAPLGRVSESGAHAHGVGACAIGSSVLREQGARSA